MKNEQGIHAFIPIILVMLIWGSMGIPSTYAVEEFSPMTVLCLRSGVGAAVLLPFVWRRHGTVRPGKGEGLLLTALSVIGVVLCNYLYFFAVQHTALTNVAILYALGPVITTVLAVAFLKETARQSRVLGILLAFFGVAALITNGHVGQLLSIGFNVGDVAEFASSGCLAVYTILSRKLRRTTPDCAVFWLMAIGFVVTLPIVLVQEGGLSLRGSWRGIASVVYLGVLCSGAGYLLQQKSIQTIGASTSAAFLNGISPITILSAAVILGEQVTLAQVACIGVVFFFLFLNARNMTLVHLPPK